jgi:hypothetical protein
VVEDAGGTGGIEMIIHYQNRRGMERVISNVIHLQNIGNDIFEALTKNGKTLMLRQYRGWMA